MKALAVILLGTLVLAHAPAFAQERGRDRARLERQDAQPRERTRDERGELRRERRERGEVERHRFSREERDKLREDLLDANRDLKRRR